MKLEYDKEVDAAYVYLQYPLDKGSVKKTVELDEHIILDFDGNDKLVGIEIIDASEIVNDKVLLASN